MAGRRQPRKPPDLHGSCGKLWVADEQTPSKGLPSHQANGAGGCSGAGAACILIEARLTCSAKKFLGRLPLNHSSKATFEESVGAFRLGGAFSPSSTPPPSSSPSPSPCESRAMRLSSAEVVARDSLSPGVIPTLLRRFFFTGFRPVMSFTDIDSPYLLSTWRRRVCVLQTCVCIRLYVVSI